MVLLSTKYRELFMIKHALEYYVTREEASLKDVEQELRLLKKVEEEIELVEIRWNIK